MNPFAPLIGNELNLVEQAMRETLTGSTLEAHVNALCLQMVNAGGKRIRPTMVLLCAKALPTYQAEQDEWRAIKLAAAVELLHTATLIHDDVIDNSCLRRGVRTINDTSGNHAAILAGDYLFTRCFNLLRDVNSLKATGEISNTLATLVAGELKQLEKEGCLDLSPDDYAYTIYCKTGALFEISAAVLAVVREESAELISALKAYGRATGSAFQIADDNLDYAADTETLGKKAGIDLADGRITLPVILALRQSQEQDRSKLEEAIQAGDFAAVKTAIEKTGALAAAHAQALEQVRLAQQALSVLPDSPYKEALYGLAERAVKRCK